MTPQTLDFIKLYNALPRVKRDAVQFVVQTFWAEQKRKSKKGEKK